MTLEATPEAVVGILRGLRLPLHDEIRTQADIHAAFGAAGFDCVREHRLDRGRKPDFFFPGTGMVVEIKVKGGKRAIHDQCRRYCEHPDVRCLVLGTAVATGFPPELAGKPCYVASLGRGWL